MPRKRLWELGIPNIEDLALAVERTMFDFATALCPLRTSRSEGKRVKISRGRAAVRDIQWVQQRVTVHGIAWEDAGAGPKPEDLIAMVVENNVFSTQF
jgi:hypothetical protein